MIGNAVDETNFPHNFFLARRQVPNLLKAFANKASTNIKLSKTHLSKMAQSRGFLGRLLVPLPKAGLPLVKNLIKPLGKSVLIPLGLTAAAAVADTAMHKKTRNKKEKHNKIVMLAWSKLNSRKSKISAAAIKNKTSHEDFMTIINEEKNIEN